jgi:hypothetical protein
VLDEDPKAALEQAEDDLWWARHRVVESEGLLRAAREELAAVEKRLIVAQERMRSE